MKTNPFRRSLSARIFNCRINSETQRLQNCNLRNLESGASNGNTTTLLVARIILSTGFDVLSREFLPIRCSTSTVPLPTSEMETTFATTTKLIRFGEILRSGFGAGVW